MKFFHKLFTDLQGLRRYPQTYIEGKPNYDAYWRERRGEEGSKKSSLTSWQKQRVDIITPFIEAQSSLVDIGCGDGSISKYLSAQKDLRVLGIDTSDVALRAAQAEGIPTLKLDIFDPSQYMQIPEADYVVAFEIIEHMPNSEDFLMLLRQKACKAIFVSIPNSGYYIHRLRLLFGHFPLQWVNHPGEHVRFWTVLDFYQWCSMLRLNPQWIITYEGLPFLNQIFPRLFAQGIIAMIPGGDTTS